MLERTRNYMIQRIANETDATISEVMAKVNQAAQSGGRLTFNEALAMLYGSLFVAVESHAEPGKGKGQINRYLVVTFNASEILYLDD